MKKNKPKEKVIEKQYQMLDRMISESYGGEYDAMMHLFLAKIVAKSISNKIFT